MRFRPMFPTSCSISPDSFAQVKSSTRWVASSQPTGPPDAAGAFNLPILLQPNRLNRLTVSASNAAGQTSPTRTIEIIHDAQPPTLHIDFPANGSQVFTPTATIAGRVGDALSGYEGLDVTVNGEPAAVVVGIGPNGTFERTDVPLTLGPNQITAIATDMHGNEVIRRILITRVDPGPARIVAVSGNSQTNAVLTRLDTPIEVEVTDTNGNPWVGKDVTFHVIRSDGRLAPATDHPEPGNMTFTATTDAAGRARAFWRLGGDAGCGNNRVEVRTGGIDEVAYFCASAHPGPATQLNVGSGNNQAAEINGFPIEPLRAWVSDSCNGIEGVPVTFTVTHGGGLVNGQQQVTLPTSRTGHSEVEFQLGPVPGNQTVVANFVGHTGSPAVFTVRGVERDPEVKTSFSAICQDNAGQPLGGVLASISVGGQTVGPVTSNVDGVFNLTGIPAGGFADLYVNARPATSLSGTPIPTNSYPALHFQQVLVENAENTHTGPILFPKLNPVNEVRYDGTHDVTLSCEGIEGLQMTVKAGSMTRADGSKPSPADPEFLSLNQVHHDDVPMPMPDGANPPFAWTFQPGGATFDPPVEIRYPNMSGLPGGAIAYFLTYDHDVEQFQIVSSGHVTDDGAYIMTDENSGLTLSGWGCNCPPYSVTGECCKPSDCQECRDGELVNKPDGTSVDDQDDCTINDRCENGIATGDATEPGTSACISTPNPEFIIDFSETINGQGGNFATIDSVFVDGSICYDDIAKGYRYNVTRHGYKGRINLTQNGSVEPTPVPGGNITQSNYCQAIAVMVGYLGRGRAAWGDGAWHTWAASRAHEEYHRDVDFRRIYDRHSLSSIDSLNKLFVSCKNTSPAQTLATQASRIITDLERKVLRDQGTFAGTHNNQASDGAYQAGQAILNQMITRVQNFATSQGWPGCQSNKSTTKKSFGKTPPPAFTHISATHDGTRLMIGQQAQVILTGHRDDGSTVNITNDPMVFYSSCNPAIASVTQDGLVAAQAPGVVNIPIAFHHQLDHLPLSTVITLEVIDVLDRDGDMMPNNWEIANGLDPDTNDADNDEDADGLNNVSEYQHNTDPQNPDTDGDTVLDGIEVEAGDDPLASPVLDENWLVKVNGQIVKTGWFQIFSYPEYCRPRSVRSHRTWFGSGFSVRPTG